MLSAYNVAALQEAKSAQDLGVWKTIGGLISFAFGVLIILGFCGVGLGAIIWALSFLFL